LARLDQQIKKIVDGVEKSVLRSTSEAVVRGILHDLAQAQSTVPKIAQLRQAFRLDELLGESVDDVDLDAPDKPSPDVLKSVAAALGKEVEEAQDMLATAFEARNTDSASLAPLMELLHRIGGTVEMAGAPALKQLVDALIAACDDLGEGRIANTDATAMSIAQALLAVEGGAREMHRSSTQWQQQVDLALEGLRGLSDETSVPGAHGIEVSDAALTEGEYQQLLGVVAAEVGVNLGRIEEALEGFATHTTQLDRLDEVPKQLEQIQGALQILAAERAVELAAVTRRYASSRSEERTAPRSTFPFGFSGRCCTRRQRRGRLAAESRSRSQDSTASRSNSPSTPTTAAPTTSPHSGSGRPTTQASRTEG